MKVRPGIALLVDGDNLPPQLLPALLDHLATHEEVSERRVFRNWRSTRDSETWDTMSKRFGFERVDRYRTTEGKNGSDIAVAVSAMDLYHGGTRSFCIASGDTDFAPLVERLRRGGSRVYWVGHKADGGLLAELADEYIEWRTLMPEESGARKGPRRQARAPAKAAAAAPATKPAPPRRAPRAPSRPAAKGHAEPKRAARPQRPQRPAAPKKAAARVHAPSGPAQGTDARLRELLLDGYEVARTDGDMDHDGWVAVDRMGQIVRMLDPKFTPRGYGLGARTPFYRAFERFPALFEVAPFPAGGNRQYRVRRRPA